MLENVDLTEAIDLAQRERDYISSMSPLQTWHDIRDRVYMIEQLTKVNEDQSKALDEIGKIATHQIDNIRFPKKK